MKGIQRAWLALPLLAGVVLPPRDGGRGAEAGSPPPVTTTRPVPPTAPRPPGAPPAPAAVPDDALALPDPATYVARRKGRCGAVEPPYVQLFFPRGDVRPEDLDAFALQVNVTTYVGPGRLEFRRGAEVLAVIEPFDPPYRNTWTPVPPSVRASLSPGDEATWGWYSSDAKAPFPSTTALFRLVAADPLPGHAAPGSDRPPTTALLLRAEALRRRGLSTAAFRVAYAAAQGEPDDPVAWATVLEAMDPWGADDSEFRSDVLWRLVDPRPGGAVPTLTPPATPANRRRDRPPPRPAGGGGAPGPPRRRETRRPGLRPFPCQG
jgi:hypothetical protein